MIIGTSVTGNLFAIANSFVLDFQKPIRTFLYDSITYFGIPVVHFISFMAFILNYIWRCGDIRRGVNIANELDSKQLKRECADILEHKKVGASDQIRKKNIRV